MAGKSADDNKSDINKGAKRNYNKTPTKPKPKPKAKKKAAPKPRSKPARKAAPPKPRAKPARKATPPKPRAKPARASAKSGASRSTAGKKVSLPRAGMKSKGPAPKSNKSRKGHRIDRVR